MAMDMVKTKITLCLSLALTVPSLSAGEWLFKPKIKINETYTDNVELLEYSETSSLVSQTAIILESEYQSTLIKFDLTSESTYAFYSHNHDIDNDYHTLDTSFVLKLGNNNIFIFGDANIDNQSKNGARNSLADIVSADITQVEDYRTGLTYNTANSQFVADVILGYSLKQTDDGIGESKGYFSNLNFDNGSGTNTLFWDTDGNYEERENRNQTSRIYQAEIKLGWITNYKLNPFIRYYDEDNKGNLSGNRSLESNSYGLGIRWQISSKLNIDVSYNQPISTKVDLDGNEQDDYIDTSVEWRPTQRTSLIAGYTQRFYGDAYNLNLSHQNKRLTNTINYTEEVQSFTRDNYLAVALGSFWCPSGNTENLSNCYLASDTNINFDDFQLVSLTDYELIEDNVLSLNKKFSWNSKLELPRTSFTLTLLGNNREELETGINNENLRASFKVSRRVSGHSILNLKASYTDNHFKIDTEAERQERYRQVSIGFNKSLNSQLFIDLDIGHVNRSSNNQQFNYNEGRLTLTLNKEF